MPGNAQVCVIPWPEHLHFGRKTASPKDSIKPWASRVWSMFGHRFSREWSLDSHLKGQKSALLFCILSKVNRACQTHKYLQSSEFNKCRAPQASLFRSLGLVNRFCSGCLEILHLSTLHEAPPVTAQVYLREQRETLLLLLSSQGQGHFSATILA